MDPAGGARKGIENSPSAREEAAMIAFGELWEEWSVDSQIGCSRSEWPEEIFETCTMMEANEAVVPVHGHMPMEPASSLTFRRGNTARTLLP